MHELIYITAATCVSLLLGVLIYRAFTKLVESVITTRMNKLNNEPRFMHFAKERDRDMFKRLNSPDILIKSEGICESTNTLFIKYTFKV